VADPKPDYAALAREWGDDFLDAFGLASLTALLERVAGEANSRAKHWEITSDAHATMIEKALEITGSSFAGMDIDHAMSEWTRANVVWLEVCKSNPKRDDETWAEWVARLSKLMAAARVEGERLKECRAEKAEASKPLPLGHEFRGVRGHCTVRVPHGDIGCMRLCGQSLEAHRP